MIINGCTLRNPQITNPPASGNEQVRVEPRISAFRSTTGVPNLGISPQTRQYLDAETRITLTANSTFSPIVVSGQSTPSQPLSDRITSSSTTSLNSFSPPFLFPFMSPTTPVYMPPMYSPSPFTQVSYPVPLAPVSFESALIPSSGVGGGETRAVSRESSNSLSSQTPLFIVENNFKNLSSEVVGIKLRIQNCGEFDYMPDNLKGRIVATIKNLFESTQPPLNTQKYDKFRKLVERIGTNYNLLYKKLTFQVDFQEFIKEGKDVFVLGVTQLFPKDRAEQLELIELLEKGAPQ